MFPIGTRVETVMGCRVTGEVIRPTSERTDGSFRPPQPGERVTYVRNDQGQVGWYHTAHLRRIEPADPIGDMLLNSYA